MIYEIIISLTAVLLTVYDKYAAKNNKWRIRENTLLAVSMLGGSVAMLITMKKIRHKTKHKKFMTGIPVIIILQLALIIYFCLKVQNPTGNTLWDF